MSKLVARLPGALLEFSRPRLATFWKYAKVEFKPPTPGEIAEITQRFGQLVNTAQSGKWRQLTVKEAVVNTFVGVEIVLLFYIGEIIGRGSLVGYDVSRVKPTFPFAI